MKTSTIWWSRLLVVVTCIGLTNGMSARADLLFPNFASTSGLTLVGSATQVSKLVRLTPEVSEQAGGLWATTPQLVAGGFETSFVFKMYGGVNRSDGMAFVIRNDGATTLAGAGGRLGYGGFGDELIGIPNSLAIEFDTFQNSENDDPSSNHVSVHSRGVLANSANELYSFGAASPASYLLANGVPHLATILYTPGTLSVFVDDLGTPLLEVNVDLTTLLQIPDGTATVGFTAGTGGGNQNHEVINWSYQAIPEPSTLMLGLLTGLSGMPWLMRRNVIRTSSAAAGPTVPERTPRESASLLLPDAA